MEGWPQSDATSEAKVSDFAPPGVVGLGGFAIVSTDIQAGEGDPAAMLSPESGRRSSLCPTPA